jgi:tetratricopeptide (TPR) repeat protein
MRLGHKMMKKILIFISACFITGTINGQLVYETLLHSGALIKTGKTTEAVDLLSSAIQEKQDSRLYIERAKAYIEEGDYQSAISDYKTANSLTQYSGDYGLSRIYALKGDAGTSLYHLERNIGSPFRKSEKEVLLDPAYGPIENSPEWRQFWKKEWYSSLETGVSEIEYYISASMNDDAVIGLSELESEYKDNEEVLYARALFNLSAGKPAEAIKILTGITNSHPDNEKYLRLLAKAQTAASNHAGASVIYSKLIALEIPDADLYISRAECYRKTGETNRAMTDIEKFLNLYPQNKKALSLAGKIETAAGDYLKALEYFSENLRYHPNDPECYIDRADAYLLSRSWDWAMKDYSMSLDLDPSNSEVWLNKGIALFNSGKKEDACHDFRNSFNLGNKRATEYISRHCIK